MTEPILKGDRLPVGAVLRIGRKNPQKGYPELNDRFFIVSRHESEATFGDRKGTVRHPLPEFASFNEKSERKGITVLRGELVRAERPDFWDYRRRAQQLPGKEWPAHPNRRPACESRDGVTANRFYGIGEDEAEDWREIECPGRQCPFAQEIQTQRGTIRPCSVFGRLYFVPRWKDDRLPAPLMMWANHSWESSENVEGFLNYVADTAREFNLERFSFAGVPFILTLTMKTKPSKGRRYPVVDMTPDGSLVDVFAAQRASAALAGGEVPLRLASAPEEQAPEVIDADAVDISEPGVPGTLFD